MEGRIPATRLCEVYRYSEISHSGRSEKRIPSLQGHSLRPKTIFSLQFQYILRLPKRTTSLQRAKEAKVSFI